MTTKQAVRILIRHSAANIRGVGQGIEAANDRKMDDSDRFNLGI